MNEAKIAKIVWLAIILAAMALATSTPRDPSNPVAAVHGAVAPTGTVPLVQLGDGRQAIADAGGELVPLDNYRRIASASAVADELLLALAEPERIVALTQYGREHSRDAHLYGDRLEITGPADVELLRKHRIDLLILNHFGAPAELARARESGARVFNLGEMRGMRTLTVDMEAVAILLGDRARGVRLARSFERRLHAVAADIAPQRRKRALYVSAYAGQLFGGTIGTSYHDVLMAAGLIDVAAVSFVDWPKYDPEQVLAFDPDVIITTEASGMQLCRTSGLDHLRVCQSPDAVVGLPEGTIENSGLGMLEAAEQVRDRVYGRGR